jgi:hypothetical protein
MQAEMQLGLLHFGDEKDRPKPDLRLARHTIDLLAALQDKTKGNLELQEKLMLDNTVTELRFRYVQALEQPKEEPKEGPKEEPTAAASETE